jgi:hypothetical protein
MFELTGNPFLERLSNPIDGKLNVVTPIYRVFFNF